MEQKYCLSLGIIFLSKYVYGQAALDKVQQNKSCENTPSPPIKSSVFKTFNFKLNLLQKCKWCKDIKIYLAKCQFQNLPSVNKVVRSVGTISIDQFII